MKLLAFDTSTEALSVAVAHGGRVWARSGAGGAQASAMLIPTVLALLGEAGLTLGELDAIAFGRGPGSFTGLRTACSVVQGLAFGAGVPVLPVDTLLAVAEEARHRHGAQRIVAALDARMDEIYTAAYDFTGAAVPQPEPQLVSPGQLHVPPGWALAGNVFEAYGARLPLPADTPRLPALPTAEALLRLAPALLTAGGAVAAAGALPRYIRDKVAKTTEERSAERAVIRPAP
jgi:tRNA threonylcarbamoyladenosine biosynthesis protein TsaB